MVELTSARTDAAVEVASLKHAVAVNAPPDAADNARLELKKQLW